MFTISCDVCKVTPNVHSHWKTGKSGCPTPGIDAHLKKNYRHQHRKLSQKLKKKNMLLSHNLPQHSFSSSPFKGHEKKMLPRVL